MQNEQTKRHHECTLQLLLWQPSRIVELPAFANFVIKLLSINGLISISTFFPTFDCVHFGAFHLISCVACQLPFFESQDLNLREKEGRARARAFSTNREEYQALKGDSVCFLRKQVMSPKLSTGQDDKYVPKAKSHSG